MGGSDQQGSLSTTGPRGSGGPASGQGPAGHSVPQGSHQKDGAARAPPPPARETPAADTLDSLPEGSDMAGGRRQRGKKNRGKRNLCAEGDQEPGNGDDGDQAFRNQRYQGQFFKTKICAFWQKGQCTRGQSCKYAHGNQEVSNMPDLKNTSLCRNMTTKGSCSIQGCPFAHSPEELRATDKFYKTTMCSFSFSGRCWLGALCRHAHAEAELRVEPDEEQRLQLHDQQRQVNVKELRGQLQDAQWGFARKKEVQREEEKSKRTGPVKQMGDDDDLDLNTGMFQRASTQPVPQRAGRRQVLQEDLDLRARLRGDLRAVEEEWGRQTSQPDPVFKDWGRQTSQPDQMGDLGDFDDDLDLNTGPFQRASTLPVAVGRHTGFIGTATTISGYTSKACSSAGLQACSPASPRSSVSFGSQSRGVVVDAKSGHLGRRGMVPPRKQLWSEASDDDDFLNQDNLSLWERATTLPAQLNHATPAAAEHPRRGSGELARQPRPQPRPSLPQLPASCRAPARRGAAHHLNHPAASLSQASLSNLEDIDEEDIETPMAWCRAVTTPATMGTPCGGFADVRMQGQMMGCRPVAVMGQVPMQGQMMMVVPVPPGTVPQAVPAGAVPVMMVPQVPQRGAPATQLDGSPTAQQVAPAAPAGQFCVVLQQQDPYMMAEGNGCGGTTFNSNGCGGMVRQVSMRSTSFSAHGTQDSLPESGSFMSTPGNQQDPFSMSTPPSRQISSNYQVIQDQPFLKPNDPPSRQVSESFCGMDPEEAVKLLERAMPEHYEE